jgi:hypothetical protein
MSATAGHCDTCTCPPAPPAPPIHSCTWCTITNNHPKCLVNQKLYPLCPNCGSDPDDITLHARDCPTPEWMIE